MMFFRSVEREGGNRPFDTKEEFGCEAMASLCVSVCAGAGVKKQIHLLTLTKIVFSFFDCDDCCEIATETEAGGVKLLDAIPLTRENFSLSADKHSLQLTIYG